MAGRARQTDQAEQPDGITFAMANFGKAYDSFHLFPIYVDPKLLEAVSQPLKKRMQGKSCFNFKRTDDTLIGELAQLTERAYESFDAAGFVEQSSGDL